MEGSEKHNKSCPEKACITVPSVVFEFNSSTCHAVRLDPPGTAGRAENSGGFLLAVWPRAHVVEIDSQYHHRCQERCQASFIQFGQALSGLISLFGDVSR